MKPYDLTCVIPLYGENCEDTSLRMVSSLAVQKTNYKVRYLFFVDDTVSQKAIDQINYLIGGKGIEYHILASKETSSGYKRNIGIDMSLDESEFIWFIDQDDYLIKNETFDIILDSFSLYPTLNFARIMFLVPDNIGAFNEKTIYNTPTMPFQWVIRTELLRDCRFRTDVEYGSDIPITISILAKEKFIRFNKDLTFAYIKDLPRFNIVLYYYNYLNNNSYMNKHTHLEDEKKQKEIDKAYEIIAEIRDKYEK